MSFDLLIPFFILIILVIYLIYSRNKYEKQILALYEKKFDTWKKHSYKKEEMKQEKLVGLIFKKDYKIYIKPLEYDIIEQLKKGKFNIKDK